jgi:hypothetical protein
MFIVEITTKTGKVCERFRSYARARLRIDQFQVEDLVGIPCIYQELPDGSQRLVREDGKPLQWHRMEDDAPFLDEPLPLVEPPETPPPKSI